MDELNSREKLLLDYLNSRFITDENRKIILEYYDDRGSEIYVKYRFVFYGVEDYGYEQKTISTFDLISFIYKIKNNE